MGIVIDTEKIIESDKTVSYKFEMNIVDKEYYKPGSLSPYKVDSHRGHGYCMLNKTTEEFILDEKSTDPFFLKNRMYVVIVWGTLLKILRSGDKFPEINGFAS